MGWFDRLRISGGFGGFMTFVHDLRSELGVPNTLTEFGVPREGLEAIRDMALVDPAGGGNPLPLTQQLAAQMLERAFGQGAR